MLKQLYGLKRIKAPLFFLLTLGLASASLALAATESNENSVALSVPTSKSNAPLARSLSIAPDLNLVFVASGFDQPTDITHTGDDRLFIIERNGTIRIIQGGTVLSPPFLDIDDRVGSTGNSERGLLGLAFHPDYANNGHFYVNYTNNNFDTHISRFSVSDGNPNVANANSEVVLLTVEQPAGNHNGGDLNFGPDGYLYGSLGDGGSSSNGQKSDTLLGKVLRIDVDSGVGSAPDCKGTVSSNNYTIPATNPFIDGAGGNCDEIWVTGLRNPWRFSFDRLTGGLYIADVGQGSWEEVNFQAASGSGGENYGWSCYEGNHTFNTSGCGPMSQYTFPIGEYNHSLGCSVTGGFVYRGSQFPAMVGHYLFTDFCSGIFWSLFPDGGGWQMTQLETFSGFYSTFGEGVNGELYVARYDNGTIYHIQDSTTLTQIFLPIVLSQSN